MNRIASKEAIRMGGSSRCGSSAAFEDVSDDILPPAELFPLDKPETFFARAHLPVRPADGEPTEIDIGGGARIVWKKPDIPGDYPTLPYIVGPPFPRPDLPPSPPPSSDFPPELGLLGPYARLLIPLPSYLPDDPLPSHLLDDDNSRIFYGPGWNDQHTTPSAFYQTPPSQNDPTNTTIFVGGLDPNVTEQALGRVFSQFGEVSHVQIPVGKRFGFVHFTRRSSAEEALLALNGSRLGGHNIKLSWGRQPQEDRSQRNASIYYDRNQQYESYRYAHPLHHLSARDVAAYGAYPGYRKYP